ncbi:hypothetical protein K4K55_006429 [Colletotrichum sp. SAR 10_96]|nr:hypothetical protein K4K55_006429 [Colletotrichum sp. SAR 10_96]
MEPPAKRPRTGPSPLGQQQNDEDDELNYEPEEVSQMRDPGYQLEQSRNFAAFKLKSTFEHIFAKYEKDFTGIGDEIDLKTGKVVINNGHLENMRHERDMGVPDEEEEEDEGMLLEEAFGSDDEEEDDEEDGAETTGQPDEEEEEERILHGKKGGSTSTALTRRPSTEIQRRPSLSSIGGLESEQRLSSLVAPRRPGSSSSVLPGSVWGADPEPADPTWKVPEIRKPKLGDSLMANMHGSRYRFPISYQSIWSSRPDTEEEKMTADPARIDMKMLSRARQESMRVGRPTSMKLLQAFTAQDDDNDDDDILGVSIAERAPRAEKKKESTATGDMEPSVETSDKNAEEDQSVVSGEDPATQEAPTKPSPFQKEAIGKSKKSKQSKEQKEKGKLQAIQAKVQLAENHVEPGKVQPAKLAVAAEISSETPSFVTGDEAQRLPKQKLVIELLSKTPPPGEVTEVLEPEDANTYGLNESFELPTQSDTAGPGKIPGAYEPQIDSDTIMPETDSSSAAKPSETTESQPRKAPEPPKEKFIRHQIDPSYDFSDDEEGIPTMRVPTRIQKPAPASPSGNTNAPVPNNVEYVASTSKVPLNDAETTTANEEAEEEDVEDQIQTSPATPLADKLDGMDLDAAQPESPEAPAEAPEELPDAGGHSSPRQSTEDPSTMEQRSVAEPEGEDTILPDVETEEPEVADTAEASPSPVNSPIALPEVTNPSDSGDNQEEGFSVPLLDDIGAESATEAEAEPEPEAVDIELPALPFPTHNPASSPPRSKPGRPRKSNTVPENGATSPMRTLNLNSSSPLKRRASNALKPRKSVKFNKKPSSPAAATTHHHEQPSLPAGPSSSTIKASPRTPSARRSFISLLSDDEDELTLDLFKAWTNTSGGSAPGSSGRKRTSYAPVLLASPQTKITTPMEQRSHNVGSGGRTDRGKKRKAAWAFVVTPTKVQFGSPSGSLVKTPGGHMRRCGEDGFKCDRDFCFTCL